MLTFSFWWDFDIFWPFHFDEILTIFNIFILTRFLHFHFDEIFDHFSYRENKDHKDIGNLDKAMTKIKKVVNHINEDKRKTEGQVQIFEIFSDIENCPPDLVSSHRVFLSKIDVVELGGSDELCGKGYELSLFLFSDVMEISKKKSAAKGLGLRSPSTMSLRNVGIAPAPGPIKDPSKDSATKYHKHVNLMNLTAIKRVVDVTETQVDAGIFALVCRTNQVKKHTLIHKSIL